MTIIKSHASRFQLIAWRQKEGFPPPVHNWLDEFLHLCEDHFVHFWLLPLNHQRLAYWWDITAQRRLWYGDQRLLSLKSPCHVQVCKVKHVAAVKERTFHQPLLGDTSAYQTSVVSASDPWKGLCYLSEVCVLYALLLFQGLESLLSKLQKPATAVLGETYWSVGDYMR